MSPALWRPLGFLLAAVYILYTLIRPQSWTFLNYVDLVFHEAGHVLFMPFGEFMTILGGSLFQILLPALIAVYFWLWRRDLYAAAVSLLWCAQNFGGVSVYVADARARALPLLGDDPDSHDWWQLLIMLNRLDQDTTLARIVLAAGFGVFALAIWAGYRSVSVPVPAEV
jgi:hypothetical protein